MGNSRSERYVLSLPNPSSAMCLAGMREENIKTIAEITGARLVLRGQDLLIDGNQEQIDRCEQIIKALQPLWNHEKAIASVDIQAACEAIAESRESAWRDRATISRNRRGDSIQPRTYRQQQYVQAMETHDLVFGVGPAGTGKTMIACRTALEQLKERQFGQLVITKPLVSVEGEDLGFLPGNMRSKMSPWIESYLDIFKDYYSMNQIEDMIKKDVIKLAPLAYCRGNTYSNSFVICDESQNTTPRQLKMLLTRLDHG